MHKKLLLIMAFVFLAGCAQQVTETKTETNDSDLNEESSVAENYTSPEEEEEGLEVTISSLDASKTMGSYDYRYRVKDWGSGTPDIRIDISPYSIYDTYSIILKGDEENGWKVYDGDSAELSNFTQEWNDYYPTIETMIGSISSTPECGEGSSCTILGNVGLYNLTLNPALDDSVFQG